MTVIIETGGRTGRTTEQVARELVSIADGDHADVWVEISGVRTSDELAAKWLATQGFVVVAHDAPEVPVEPKPKRKYTKRSSTEGAN